MIRGIRFLHYESISLNYRTLYIRVLFLQLILETRLDISSETTIGEC